MSVLITMLGLALIILTGPASASTVTVLVIDSVSGARLPGALLTSMDSWQVVRADDNGLLQLEPGSEFTDACSNNTAISVYTPGQKVFDIFSIPNGSHISVTNINGTTIYKGQYSSGLSTIVSPLKAGIYFARFQAHSQEHNLRFLITGAGRPIIRQYSAKTLARQTSNKAESGDIQYFSGGTFRVDYPLYSSRLMEMSCADTLYIRMGHLPVSVNAYANNYAIAGDSLKLKAHTKNAPNTLIYKWHTGHDSSFYTTHEPELTIEVPDIPGDSLFIWVSITSRGNLIAVDTLKLIVYDKATAVQLNNASFRSYNVPENLKPIIDGSIDDVWKKVSLKSAAVLSLADLSHSVFIDRNDPATYAISSDASVAIHSVWDQNALYFLMIIKEDHVVNINCNQENLWRMDALNLFLDPTTWLGFNSSQYFEDILQRGIMYRVGEYSISINKPIHPEETRFTYSYNTSGNHAVSSPPPGMVLASGFKADDNMTVAVEIKIPWWGPVVENIPPAISIIWGYNEWLLDFLGTNCADNVPVMHLNSLGTVDDKGVLPEARWEAMILDREPLQ